MNVRAKRSKLLLSMFVLGMIGAGASAADNGHNAGAELSEYVVTATRTEKAQLDVPANTIVITSKQLQEGGYNNIFTALQQLGQLSYHGYSEDGYDYGSMQSRLKVRGLDQGTLVLLNGNPIDFTNYAIVGGIPIDQIKKIEIVKGAGSVLYGSSAMAGTINIITKTPKEQDSVTGSIEGGIGNQRKSSTVTINANRVIAGFTTEVITDNMEIERPGVKGEGTTVSVKDKHGSQAYAMVKLSPITTLTYSHSAKHSQVLTGKFKNFVSNYTNKGDFDTVNNFWNILMDNKKTGWKVSTGWNETRILSVYDKAFTAAHQGKLNTSSDNKGHSFNIDVQKKLSARQGKDILILGANFTQEQLGVQYGETYSSDKTTSYALFQSYEYNPTDKMTTIFGLREYMMTPSKYQKEEKRLLPQIQVLYRNTDHSSWYASASRSFVMPRINYAFNYKSTVINPGLRPEEGWSYEMGYKYDKDNNTLTANLFYIDVKDKATWSKDKNDNSIMKNLERWHNTGLEINYGHKFSDELSSKLGVTWQAPVAIENEVSAQDDARFILNLGTTYQKDKWSADLDVFSYLKRQKAYYNLIHTSSKFKDHYLKNSVNVRLALHYAPNKDDMFTVVGDSLLNRKDDINVYEYTSRPTSVYASYTHKF